MNRPDHIPAAAEADSPQGWAYAPGPNGTTVRVAAVIDLGDPLRIVPFGAPERRETRLGTLAYALEKGPKERNEDGQFSTRDGLAFGVVDGVGGASDGDKAAHILAASLRACLESSRGRGAVQAAAYEAHGLMADLKDRQERLFLTRPSECAAVFAACLVRVGAADVPWSGDALVALVRGGKLVRTNEPHRETTLLTCGRRITGVTSFVASDIVGPMGFETWELLPGDVLVCGTDGFGDNVDPAEMAAVVGECPDPVRAVSRLGALALSSMIYGFPGGLREGKPDNIAVQVFSYRGPAA